MLIYSAPLSLNRQIVLKWLANLQRRLSYTAMGPSLHDPGQCQRDRHFCLCTQEFIYIKLSTKGIQVYDPHPSKLNRELGHDPLSLFLKVCSVIVHA
jgi:hypothetical protein